MPARLTWQGSTIDNEEVTIVLHVNFLVEHNTRFLFHKLLLGKVT